MFKLIASDLDGTIIGNSNFIPKDNVNAVLALKKHNIPLVICTGKTYMMCKEVCQNLHADFGVFGNGCQIVDLTTGNEIFKRTLTNIEIDTLFRYYRKIQCTCSRIYRG